jgi:hypothetical protein
VCSEYERDQERLARARELVDAIADVEQDAQGARPERAVDPTVVTHAVRHLAEERRDREMRLA